MGLHSFGFYLINIYKIVSVLQVLPVFFLVKQFEFGENQGGDHSGVKELLRKGKSII